MGGNHSQLTEEELLDYKELTNLTGKEIIHIFNRFKDIDEAALDANKAARLPASLVVKIPELQNNPFADRMCDVFSSKKDGLLSFEDFLDMMDVFSGYSSVEKKAHYAFKIYDFDEDGYLSPEDISQVINRLTKKSEKQMILERELSTLAERIIGEADLDKDNKLSPKEFQHAIYKSPDFLTSFQIRL